MPAGICGATSIDQVLRRPGSRSTTSSGSRPADLAAPDLLREQQRAFDKTGGLHAAGLLEPDGTWSASARTSAGTTPSTRWWAGPSAQGRLPLRDTILVVSGRASFELTQKAVLAGIPILAAVSAPSSLAVELAAEAGLTLVGFVRGETMNIYAHPDRIVGDTPEPGAFVPAYRSCER